jgi:hypothetical protein
MTLDKVYRIFDAIEPDEYGCHNGPWRTEKAQVAVDGIRYRVTRLALERKLGRPILPGYCALHDCDNPRCVSTEPGHVYEGTYSDNLYDRNRDPVYVENRREHLRKLNQSAEARERGRKWAEARWAEHRAEAAERCRWVEEHNQRQINEGVTSNEGSY